MIQGVGGGIFPLAFSIIRDEFPNERVPGSIGLVSSLLGIGGGAGVVFAGVVTENLSYHWLFWFPLGIIVFTAYLTRRYIPESPVKTPAEINYRAAALMTLGISGVLLAITETSTWGWGSPKTLGLLAVGMVVIVAWVREELRSREPLVDMRMMAIRGVWTTNTVAFLIGVGMYSSFVLLPELVQEPASTGYGFGASVDRGRALPAAGDDRDRRRRADGRGPRAPHRVARLADRRHPVRTRLLRPAGRRSRHGVADLPRRWPARDRHRPLLLCDGQPDRAEREPAADGRGDRDERRDPHARRRLRRTAGRDPSREQPR